MSAEKLNCNETVDVSVNRGASSSESVDVSGIYTAVCRDVDGNVKWSDEYRNIVTTVGKNSLLDVYLGASTQITTWYLGLISSTSYSAIAAADTAASHAGWKEAGPTFAPAYSEGFRQTAAWSAAASGSKATSSAAIFTMSSSGTVKGSFLISNNAKDGITGTLYSAGLFSAGDKTVTSGDTISVSYTATA